MNPLRHCLLLSLLATAVLAAPPLHLDVDEDGLTSLRHNGEELLIGNQLELVSYLQGEQQHRPKPQTRAYGDGSYVVDYGDLALAWRLEATGATLDAHIVLRNQSEAAIDGISLNVVSLRMPRTAHNSKQQRLTTNGLSDAPDIAALAEGSQGMIGISNWHYGEPITFGGRFHGPERMVFNLSGVQSPQIVHPVYDPSLLQKPSFSLAGGETKELHVSLTFGTPESELTKLCKPVLDAYREQRPYRQSWPDRRPIAALFISNPHTGWATNPRGYITGERQDDDVTTPAGLAAFGERLIAYAERCVELAGEANAQGVIVWDLEGQEAPHAISYLGDPRKLAEVAPEMERFADAFFKVFTDAGLKVGLTIRPTEVIHWKSDAEREAHPYQTFGKQPLHHREVADPAALLIDTITYARERWGCSIFYLDSNVHSPMWLRDKEGNKPTTQGVGWQLPLELYERVFAAHPEVLLIPEWGLPSFYATSSPYRSPNLGQIFPPALSQALYPDSFSAIMVTIGLINERLDDYRRAVQAGNVLLYNGWYPNPEMRWAEATYQEAQFLKQRIAPDAEGAVEQRWAAARKRHESVESIRSLAALTADEALVVAHAAVESLAALPPALHQEERAGIDALQAIIAGKGLLNRCLQVLAAEAIGQLGPFGATFARAQLAILDDAEANASKRNQQVQLALKTLAFQESLSAELAGPLLVILDQGLRQNVQINAIALLGRHRVEAAVEPLIHIVRTATERNQEDLSLAAIEALGQIGDKAAIPALIANWDRRYTSMAVYRYEAVMNTALQQLTGAEERFGPQAWRAWEEEQ